MAQSLALHRIGEAARQSGVSAANIRYYEKEGLLPPGARSDNSYRLYSADEVHRLRFIRLCRAMDMSLDEVRTLLALDWARKGTAMPPATRWTNTCSMCAPGWQSCKPWRPICSPCAAAAMAPTRSATSLKPCTSAPMPRRRMRWPPWRAQRRASAMSDRAACEAVSTCFSALRVLSCFAIDSIAACALSNSPRGLKGLWCHGPGACHCAGSASL